MAYSAVLEFGDNSSQRYSKQFLLANFRLVLNRAYKVVPTGAVRCERLELVVVAPDKTNLALFDWFLNRSFRWRLRAERRSHHDGYPASLKRGTSLAKRGESLYRYVEQGKFPKMRHFFSLVRRSLKKKLYICSRNQKYRVLTL